MNAAAEFTDAQRAGLAPMGIPVRDGRISIGRLRELLPRDEVLELVAGFDLACWIGPGDARAPDLGRLTYRSRTAIDRRGRVPLDHRARTWLAATDARTLIGQRPENPIDHFDWLAATDTVKDARRALGFASDPGPVLAELY